MLTDETEPYIIDVISLLGEYLWRNGYTSGDPTENTGAEYENEVFLISAYDWDDDKDHIPNFWFKPLNYQVEWHDHLGRATFTNATVDVCRALLMLQECLESIDADLEPQYDPPDFEWEYQESDEE
jgi:hypothetical protein